MASIVFFIPSGDGTLRFEIDDPAIEVAIKGTNIVLKNADNGKDVVLTAGAKNLLITRGDFSFEADKLILKKGETVTVRVEFIEGRVQLVRDGQPFAQKELPKKVAAVEVKKIPAVEEKKAPDKIAPVPQNPEAPGAAVLLSNLQVFNPQGKRLTVGDKVEVQFYLTNISGNPLNVPANLRFNDLGTIQAWIERLGDDPAIAAKSPKTAKKGRLYAAGGGITPTPPVIPAEFRKSFAKTIETEGFPPGSYRYTIEFKPSNNTIGPAQQFQSIEFQLQAP